MNIILSFICLLLLGCGFALNGDDPSPDIYYVTTTIHRPLEFNLYGVRILWCMLTLH